MHIRFCTTGAKQFLNRVLYLFMIHRYTDYSLLPHNTFGMDVKAAFFVEYTSVDDLQTVLAERRRADAEDRLLPIGGGSNLLFGGDFSGTVLHSAIRGMMPVAEDDSHVWVKVGAGEVWDDFVAHCVDRGWYGAENLSAIPGEVGASAVQNIGAYGAEVKDLITEVEVVEVATGALRLIPAADCWYAYRQSIFKNEWKGRFIVTHVTYRLGKQPDFRLDYGNLRTELEGKPLTLAAVREAVRRIRDSKLPDPRKQGNAGSFFMNPVVERPCFERIRADYPSMPFYEVDADHVKIPAGWMIDQCGWKGRALGRAGVHDRQALVLVNRGGATGAEVMALAEAVRRDVKEKFGVEIHPEVNYIV